MSKSAFGMSSSLIMMLIGMINAKNQEQQTINQNKESPNKQKAIDSLLVCHSVSFIVSTKGNLEYFNYFPYHLIF